MVLDSCPYIHGVSPDQLLVVAIFGPLICLAFVILRFLNRKLQGDAITVDDWLIIPATGALIGMGICSAIVYAEVSPSSITVEDFMKSPSLRSGSLVLFSFEVLVSVALGFTKLNVVFFYRRVLAAVVHPILSLVSWTYIVCIILWTASFVILCFFLCAPVKKMPWIPIGAAPCLDTSTVILAGLITDLATDILIMALPLPVILKLNVSVRRKLAILAVFFVGLMAIGASGGRLATYFALRRCHGFAMNFPAIKNTINTIIWWTLLEASLGTLAACLPDLMFLMKKVIIPGFMRLPQSFRSGRSYGH